MSNAKVSKVAVVLILSSLFSTVAWAKRTELPIAQKGPGVEAVVLVQNGQPLCIVNTTQQHELATPSFLSPVRKGAEPIKPGPLTSCSPSQIKAMNDITEKVNTAMLNVGFSGSANCGFVRHQDFGAVCSLGDIDMLYILESKLN